MNENIMQIYNVLDIIRGTTVDGPGFRTAIYLAGCTHKCLGCHNPQSWDVNSGIPMSLEEIIRIVEEEDFDVTITGGDPLFDPHALQKLVRHIKKNRHNIWIYTGYNWEEIIVSPPLLNSIKEADVLVDGPFMEELKDPDLYFRGSSNQRIIDIKKSLDLGRIILYKRS